jgi:hypothetical protein
MIYPNTDLDEGYIYYPSPSLVALLPDSEIFLILSGRSTTDTLREFFFVDEKGIQKEYSPTWKSRDYYFTVFSYKVSSFVDSPTMTVTMPYSDARRYIVSVYKAWTAWLVYAQECITSARAEVQSKIIEVENYTAASYGNYQQVRSNLIGYRSFLDSKLTLIATHITWSIENSDYLNNLTGTGNTTPTALDNSIPRSIPNNLFPKSYVSTLTHIVPGTAIYLNPFAPTIANGIKVSLPYLYLAVLAPSYKTDRDFTSTDPNAERIILSSPGLLGAYRQTNPLSAWQWALHPAKGKVAKVYGSGVAINTLTQIHTTSNQFNWFTAKHKEGLLADPTEQKSKFPIVNTSIVDLDTYVQLVAYFLNFPNDSLISDIRFTIEETKKYFESDLIDTRFISAPTLTQTAPIQEPIFSTNFLFPREHISIIESSDTRPIRTTVGKDITQSLFNRRDQLTTYSSGSSDEYKRLRVNPARISTNEGVIATQQIHTYPLTSTFNTYAFRGRTNLAPKPTINNTLGADLDVDNLEMTFCLGLGYYLEDVYRRGWSITPLIPASETISVELNVPTNIPSGTVAGSVYSFLKSDSHTYTGTLEKTEDSPLWFGQAPEDHEVYWLFKNNVVRTQVIEVHTYTSSTTKTISNYTVYGEQNEWLYVFGDPHGVPQTSGNYYLKDDPIWYNRNYEMRILYDSYKHVADPPSTFTPILQYDETPWTAEEVMANIEDPSNNPLPRWAGYSGELRNYDRPYCISNKSSYEYKHVYPFLDGNNLGRYPLFIDTPSLSFAILSEAWNQYRFTPYIPSIYRADFINSSIIQYPQ